MNPETQAKLVERLRLFANRWQRTPIYGDLLAIREGLSDEHAGIINTTWNVGAAIQTVADNPICWPALPELISILRLLAKLK